MKPIPVTLVLGTLLGTLLGALLGAVGVMAGATGAPDEQDPRATRSLYARPDSVPAKAAAEDPVFEPIGRRPMAQWMSEVWFPLDTVAEQARAYADAANAQGRTPLVAIYAIPARDCVGESSGGFGPDEYKAWIARLATGLKGSHAMAVLEPDALGHLDNCEGQGDRTGLLRYATRKLGRAGVWVYIDAAHTGWVEPEVMAERLASSGIRKARGFSVNVASFVRTDVEKRYARAIIAALNRRGITGVKYVMDTSRNGGGQTDGNDWCNPPDARLGRPPKMLNRRHIDAYVWVKAPGESDGECNGGPPAGQWWPEQALSLMGL